MQPLDKVYEPQKFEPYWAQWWIENGVFQAASDSPARMYSLVIPPPNVTGSLHMGHMFEMAETDISMRWRRMRGYNTLWLPGMDHAGIATQMVVERDLAQKGIQRREIGREKFLEHVWEWKEKYGDRIKKQIVRIGASCDWSRERFTMDEGLCRAVREAFVRLYDKGLIYRGTYLINWCPRCLTALSDLETVHEERDGHLWHLRYPVTGSQEYLVVATTRPETMLGDTAVAVNPEDERYRHLHGKTVTLPLMNREIPIITDEVADPKFGTGVVKVTPAHDPNDFAAGKRHNLAEITVMDETAHMNENAGPYAGLDRFEARRQIVAHLQNLGLLEKIEDYRLVVGTCQRCGTVVEPRISTQWFVRTKPLAEPAMAAVESGRIQIIPEQWRKVYFEWMTNIRDWCISRQLWWGHRIPAWYCEKCGEITVAREDPERCAHCGSAKVKQDPDVLDTWFSSGLWPFSTLGWPDDTADLRSFYPTSLLNTGFDILFFWVARMIMFGLEFTGEVPFRQVYIHALVRDAEKHKMSKTRGNAVDPMEVAEKFGTDAVRFSLVVGAAPGTDVVFSEDRLTGYQAFANKIWNAARFVFLSLEKAGAEPWAPENLQEFRPQASGGAMEVPLEDRWIFSRLNDVAEQSNRAIEQFRYHEVAHLLYHFIWHEFCDWYVELKKLRFQEGSGLTPEWKNLLAAFERTLRLLHPLMPFITEELWQRLTVHVAGRPRSLALAAYPQYDVHLSDMRAEREVEVLKSIIGAARDLRAQMKLDPRKVVEGTLYSKSAAVEIARGSAGAIQKLAAINLEVVAGSAPVNSGVHAATPEFDLVLRVPAAEVEARREKLGKEKAQLEKACDSSHRQLQNEEFLAKAPPAVIESIRQKLGQYEAQIAKLNQALDGLDASGNP
jgi:valyl-tRNA synthetase